MTLTNTTVLVTGASRGLGRATALALGSLGATVVVHYRSRADAADEVVAEVERSGGRAFTVAGDLADPLAPAHIIASVRDGLAQRGMPAVLHGLVTSAGEMVPGGVLELTADAIDHAFAVNVRSQILLIGAAVPMMPRGGRIVTVSAALARRANPGILAQSASKIALQDVVRNLAAELGPLGISIVDIAPGVTRTDLSGGLLGNPGVEQQIAADTALGRVGEPEDIANVIAAFLSPATAWVTGQVIEATGGLAL
jgi:bifunctional oxygenase/reductase